MVSTPPDKYAHKSYNSDEHTDDLEEDGTVLLSSKTSNIFTTFNFKCLVIIVAAVLAVTGFGITLWLTLTRKANVTYNYNDPGNPDSLVDYKRTYRANPIPDPVMDMFPDWLEGIPVEDPGTARYSASSPWKNESLAVKELYLNKILDTEYIASNEVSKTVLIIILTNANNFQRRQLMRAHQIQPYTAFKNITWRFVLGSPPPVWRQSLKYENDTYGDLLFLESVPDTKDIARSIKLLEFYKYAETNLPVYKYIAKLDTDTFVNIASLMKNYFNQDVDKFALASVGAVVRLGILDWPQGGFFAFSYKLMIFVNRIYGLVPRTVYEEDFQIGWYLRDAEVNYTRVELPLGSYIAYDFNLAWRDVFNETVRVHELKDETDYITVANCFNENGVNSTHIWLMRETAWKK